MDKLNVLWKAEQLYIIDHEMGLSFVYAIGLLADPWRISSFSWLSNHLFYHQLKGRAINLDRFAGAPETVTEDAINGIMSSIPQDWRSDNMVKIQSHITQMSS